MKNTAPLNTVETVLSQDAVNYLETFLYNYWNDTNHDCYLDILMQMLSVYVKHCPDDAHMFRKPEWTVKHVSELLHLIEHLNCVMKDERVWEWVDTVDGWRVTALDDSIV